MSVKIKYSCLLAEFISVAQLYINDNILLTLKDYYKHCINSKRKLNQIKDIKTLIKILEKRDILSIHNIEPLVHISNNFLNEVHILNVIKDYKSFLENTQCSKFCDMYQHDIEHKNEESLKEIEKQFGSIEAECTSVSQLSTPNLYTYPKHETVLQQKVLSQICERIGRSWRETVRYLGIPEYQIEIIQNKYPFDMKEQSYQALNLCISKYCTDNWKLSLIHALERARRKDLKELVEKLIIE